MSISSASAPISTRRAPVAVKSPSRSIRPVPSPVFTVTSAPLRAPAEVRSSVSAPLPVRISTSPVTVTVLVMSISSASAPISTRRASVAVRSPSRSIRPVPSPVFTVTSDPLREPALVTVIASSPSSVRISSAAVALTVAVISSVSCPVPMLIRIAPPSARVAPSSVIWPCPSPVSRTTLAPDSAPVLVTERLSVSPPVRIDRPAVAVRAALMVTISA